MKSVSHLKIAVLIGFCLLISSFAYDVKADETLPEVSVQLLKERLSKSDTVELGLPKLLEIAIEENLDLKIAQDMVKIEKARYQTGIAELLPDLKLSYTQSSYEGAIQGFSNDLFNVDRKTFQPQLIFRFPVFQGGRRIFQIRSAKKTLEAEEVNEQVTLQNTLRQAALNYYELKRSLQGISIAQKQLEETTAHLDINRARIEAGTGTRLDVLRSEAEVASAQQQLLNAVRVTQTSALKLNELLNLPAFVSLVPDENEHELKTLVPSELEVKALLETAMLNRPELKSLGKRIESLEELRKVVWSSVLPEVNFQARTGGVGPSFGDIQNFDETSYSLDLTFRNMLASVITRYKEKNAQLEELGHRLETVKNSIERELSESYLASLTGQAKISSARAELVASEQALSDAVERLQAGVGRNIDVIEAETALTRARSNLNSAVIEYNQAQVNLVYSMGLVSVESLTQGVKIP